MDRLDDGHFWEADRDVGLVLRGIDMVTVSEGRLMGSSNPWHVCHPKEGRIGQLHEPCRGFWINDDGVFEDVVCRKEASPLLQISFLAPSTTSASMSCRLKIPSLHEHLQNVVANAEIPGPPTHPSGFGWVKFCSDAPDHLRIPGVTSPCPPQFSGVLFVNDSG